MPHQRFTSIDLATYPLHESTINEEGQDNWSLKSVQWKKVFYLQDYANLTGTIAFAVVAGVVSFVRHPRSLDWFIYDATISYPYIGSPTVPEWAIIFAPIAMSVITLAVGELLYSRLLHANLTSALATMFHFFLDLLQSFIFTVFIMQISKYVAGALRPDFLSRCQPQIPSDITIQYGVPSNYPCTNPDTDTVEDGKLSFPSGHAAVGFNVTVYASIYQIWCFNMRRPWNPALLRRPMKNKFLHDFLNVLGKYWMLGMLSFAWLVSLSRTTDYQHHYADIVGGAFLGTLVAVVYAARAIPRYRRVYAVDDQTIENALEGDRIVLARASADVESITPVGSPRNSSNNNNSATRRVIISKV